jgi:16S rRNA (cytosine967-C5)-methyltransferase
MKKNVRVTLPNTHARNIAVNCLLQFEYHHHYIQDSLFEIYGREAALPPEEKRLATELAYGTCRRLISLDTILEYFSTRPLKQIEPVIRQVLRVGLYQMLFLSGTPDFAAIDQAVRQARSSSQGKADAFVNAVLRSIQRDIISEVPEKVSVGLRNAFPVDDKTGILFRSPLLPDPLKNKSKYYSRYYSQPKWLVSRWLKHFDEKTVQAICSAANARPPLVLRPNRLKQKPENFASMLRKNHINHIYACGAFFICDPISPERVPGYSEGMFTVQDSTAMSAANLLSPREDESLLDLCAAPGGKTTHLAELMNNKGSIIASDLHAERLEKVNDNCKRLGISIVKTCSADELGVLLKEGRRFDAVLVDAPCSNTGVLARRVEARHLLKPADIKKRQETQCAIMKKAAQCLKRHGRILYSTCSIEPAENEEVIQKFLFANAGFALLEQRLSLPRSDNPLLNSPTPENKAEPAPWCDGGFVALLGA